MWVMTVCFNQLGMYSGYEQPSVHAILDFPLVFVVIRLLLVRFDF